MTDASGLVYLRARYYLPGLGVLPSLDPVEEGNRYGYVGGNVVNRVDPSGNAEVDIWAAAFISDQMIRFPYGADPVAIWEGDNRSWHTLQDFSRRLPLSSRVWWSVQFDTNDLSAAVSHADTGKTLAVYAGVGIGSTYISQGKAPPPAPASVECVGVMGDIEVKMEAGLSGKNPLSVLAPPIQLYYVIYFRSHGHIEVYRDNDSFPWHELHIAVDGVSKVQMQQPPLGPSFTPADLALPALRSMSFGHFSGGKRCSRLSAFLRGIDCLPAQLSNNG